MTFADNEPSPSPVPASITLDKSELTLDVGETDALTATLYPEGTNSSVQWTSGNPSVASVTESGLITAHSAGTALITAAAAVGGASALCHVTVQDVPVTTYSVYSVDISASPTEGGTVSGGGQYKEGTTVMVTAVPNESFRFLTWTEADTQISTEASLTFGEYEPGSSVTLTATPESGYLFLGWTENNEQISTDESFIFIADSDRTLVANFTPVPKPTYYTIQVNSTQGGVAEGGSSYEEGEVVTVNAVPDNGYRFLHWEENGVQVCTEARYTFAAETDWMLAAIFDLIPQSAPNLTYEPSHDPGIPSASRDPRGENIHPVAASMPSREEVQIPTLISGKAVLIAPDNSFWRGYKTGRDNGSKIVARADLAQLVYAMMDDESRKIYGVTRSPFRDVETGAWYEAAAGTMLNTGIMFGCGDGLFCPKRTLTWGELLTVFARFTADEPLTEYYTGEHWAKDAINKAFTLGWLEYSEAFHPGSLITTAEMVDLIQAVFQWNNK